MKAQERITAALAAKHWAVSEYDHAPITYGGPDGREGGYYVVVETEDYPEVPMDESAHVLIDAYSDEFQRIQRLTCDLKKEIDCSLGVISAWTLEDVLWVIEQLADRLSWDMNAEEHRPEDYIFL